MADQTLEDRRWLEELAREMRADAEDDRADTLLAIAERIERPEVEVIERRPLSGKSPAAPDGWSWTDIGPFTGKFSGIRLQKGEPFVEQMGHVLLVRQGETSLTERQVSIYQQLSSSGVLLDGVFRPSVHVLVVFGFLGARHGFVPFSAGKQLGVREGDAEAVTGYIHSWLEWTWENVIVPRKQKPRPPKQEQLV